MKTAISALDLRRARSLDEALEILRDDGARVPVAGATDVYVAANFGTLRETRLLDIWPLDELREIRVSGDTLSIGGLATYTSMIQSRDVADRLPMLIDASRQVGGPQIQNRGTIAGNIANGSSAGDTLPVLAAAEAIVVLRSTAGERRVPIGSFYTGYRASVRRADELIVAVEVARVGGKQWFRKVGTRAAQAISKVVVAAVRAERPRIAFGSVAPTVVRVPKTEEALAGGASIDDAVRVLATELSPIDDVRSSAAYRLKVAGNLVRRWWSDTN